MPSSEAPSPAPTSAPTAPPMLVDLLSDEPLAASPVPAKDVPGTNPFLTFRQIFSESTQRLLAQLNAPEVEEPVFNSIVLC